MLNLLISTALSLSLLITPVSTEAGISGQLTSQEIVLASESLDLSNRYPVLSVSEGFKENILTAVSYFNQEASASGGLILQPGQVFAFHRNIAPEFRQFTIITQPSGFLAKDGYKVVAGLAGNGVCHLASSMNLAAQEAGLEVTAPANHNFAKIPGIDPKYGTSIKFLPNGGANTERQNLYIRNIFDFPVEFRFVLEGENLKFLIFAAS